MKNGTGDLVAFPRPASTRWSDANCDPVARMALDAIFEVGPPERVYRYGIFLKDGSHDPNFLPFHDKATALRHTPGGQHVKCGEVVGHTSHGRERIMWEDDNG